MSKQSINVAAFAFVCFLIACIASEHGSRPELPHHDGLAAQIGCGTVNFVVTAYIPQPHATAFCNAYLDKPRHTSTVIVSSPYANHASATISILTPHSPAMATSDHSSSSSWRRKARTGTVPDFEWVREQQRQTESEATLMGKVCACLALPETTTTTTVTTMASVTSAPTFIGELAPRSYVQGFTQDEKSTAVPDSALSLEKSNMSVHSNGLVDVWRFTELYKSML